MADFLHDNVYDAALAVVALCDKAEVRTSASAVLVGSVTLDAGNFAAPENGTSSGRRMQCLVSSAADMLAIAVSSAGSANQVALLDSATTIIIADLPSVVSLGASDEVNLGTFYVQFPDAT